MSHQDLHRAAQARELLEHPMLLEAMEAFEKEIIEAWKKSPLRDVEGRERLRLMLEAQDRFKLFLTSMVNTGKLISLQPTAAEHLRRVVGRS